MTIIENILELKREKNALILAHYYQRPEVQEIADYVGDSYYLSKIAKDSSNKVIVFCGVRFMAESAKILSPNKKILLPASDAGCPMADMASSEPLIELKRQHPDAAVICYINSTAEVKAECDVCVTSSNALSIIRNLPNKKIIFLPDKNLGEYISEQLPEKEFILWNGFCITHKKVTAESVQQLRELKKDAVVLTHPECEKPVRELSDFVGSTGEIISFAKKSSAKDFIIVTEQGVLHELQKQNPDKNFYVPGNTMTCINMKKTCLEDIYECLKYETNSIELDEKLRLNALTCLENMHKYVG